MRRITALERRELRSRKEASGDKGVDQDEGEAAEVGGESKGGDREGRNPVGRKRKGKGQGTLDGHFSGGKRGRR